MEEQQDQNEQPEVVVEQPKKNIIPTRLGSLIILLTAIIAAVGVQWYADLHFPPNGIEVSGLVEQMQERREVKSELPEGYEIKADGVYYMGELTEEADSEMFERLSSSYIKYKNDIYFSGERIEGFDIATFEYLGGSYVKDKDHVYYPFIRGLDFEFGIIKEVDMETFEYLDFFYAKDKNHVYELGEVSEEENWRTGEVSEEKDPATFEILNRYITKDKDNVYYYVLTSAKGIFREADPATFEILGDRYYKDKDSVYLDYFDYNKIEGADPETFEILSEGYAKDKNNVYLYSEIVEGADPANCTTKNLEGCQSGVLFGGVWIKGADSETFEIISNNYQGLVAKDKNHVYCVGEEILNAESSYAFVSTVEYADPSSFEILNEYYAKDNQGAFFAAKSTWGRGTYAHMEQDIDVDTFQIVEGYCAKDKQDVYCGHLKVSEADPDTFEVLLFDHYAIDEQSVYSIDVRVGKHIHAIKNTKKIDKADPDTFEVMGILENYGVSIGTALARDASYVFYGSMLIKEGNVQTLEIVSDYYFKDVNNVYKYGEIVGGANPANCIAENLEGCKASTE